jgi:argininosuccinate synthase
VVRLRLYKGMESVAGVESSHALYDSRLSSRDSKGVFSQKEARHFAKLYGLQDMIAYLIDADS